MTTTATEKSLLTYLVREPKVKTAKPPVLILLHGVGSNERDLFSLADQLPPEYLIISARGPLTLGPSSYAWYQVDFSTGKPVFNKAQEEKSRAIILQFIDELKLHHTFDEARVYLGGFSQGAIMSFSIGLTHPEKIKGIVVLSGRLLEEIKPSVASKAKLASLQVFISHGTQDPVLQVEYARESRAYLESLGITPAYKEYPIAHTISNDVLHDLVAWLNKK